MKKGLVYILFFTFVLCLIGCDKEHTHSSSGEWMSDGNYHWHACSDDCSELFDKAQHIWDSGVITTEATEKTEGVKTYTCTVCSSTKTEKLSVLDHTHEFSTEYSHDEVFHWYAATCEHEDETKFKELHKYEFIQQTPATCTEEEVLIGTCVCGETTIIAGEDAKGHQVSNFVSDGNATCTIDGTKTGTCDVCENVITVSDEGSMLEHAWVEKTIEPTYFTTGEAYQECSDCGEIETIEVLPQLIENVIDGEKDSFYDGVNSYSGKRTGPIVEHDTFIKLGVKGIYVYQLVTDGKGLTSTSHIELYFTLGSSEVLENSLSVHIYAQSEIIKSYTYNSSTDVKMNNNLAEEYCDYSVKVISSESNLGIYACELFVDYSYFGLTETPEFINAQVRSISGGGNPLTNNKAGTLDYKDIANYIEFDENGVVVKEVPAEIDVDGEKDDKYNSLTPLKVEKGIVRSDLGHETYVYLGEQGIYVYHVVTDSTELVDAKTHVEFYFQLGDTKVLDNSLSVHLYPGGTDNLRTYTYNSTTNVSRNNNLKEYCNHSIKLVDTIDGVSTYAYELFVDYSYFGLTETPEYIKMQVRSTSYKGGQLTNEDTSGGLDYKNIANYVKFDQNGLNTEEEVYLEMEIDGEKDDKYNSLTPLKVERGTIRDDLGHETYVYLGEKGIYVFHIVNDSTELVDTKTHVEFYFQLGNSSVLDNSFSVHLSPGGTDNLRTYTYNSTTNVSRNNNLKEYCNYSIKLVDTIDGVSTYAYELFVDYSYFGLAETLESIKMQVRSTSYKGGQLTNTNTSGGLDYKEIANFVKFDENGLNIEEDTVEIYIDGEKDQQYLTLNPIVGKRSDPFIGQEAYVYLGEKGIYVYHLVTDPAELVEKKTHVEWYFTLGDTFVLNDSFSVHMYPGGTDNLRTYTYNSTSNVARNNNLKQYCEYLIKVNTVDGVSTYTYELFVDYSYFGLTETPESIKVQLRAQSGSSPLTNSTTAGTLDYKDIANYYTFDKDGYVYSTIGVRDLELDPTDIVSGKYETEFTLQTLNILNKLSNVKFSGVGSEFITEIGNGKYRLSIPVDKMADFAEGQTITIIDPRNIGASFTIKILNEAKTTYKLLMIGNSFSDDTIQWVYEICEDLGIEITIANLYIGGATLERHLSNLLNDVNEYTYVEYDKINKTWVRNENISISEALTYEKWNYISLQQGSALSGQADTYDDMNQIMDEILKLKGNVEFIWNMTWAYQQDSTHSAFPNYDSNQETMYNAIVNAVDTKVLTNDRIKFVNPVGTAIQNARTSFVGDTLTRDGHHLSYDLGRYIAGLTMVGTLTGADLSKVQYSPNLEDKYRDMAIESAMNAIKNPYVVTQSTYVE